MTAEALISRALTDWCEAFCSKDADRLMALYAPDAVSFDAIPPFQDNVETMRSKLVGCFPYFPDAFSIEFRDQRLAVSGDLAFAHWLWRFTRLPEGHPAGQTWMRSSTIWQRRDGRWLIVHDHCSLPFNPETSQAVFSLEP